MNSRENSFIQTRLYLRYNNTIQKTIFVIKFLRIFMWSPVI